MNVEEIQLIEQLFPKYQKVDREFLILCLKHDFNNLIIENRSGRVVFDFKQHWSKNLQILTHDDIWFKEWVHLNYLKDLPSNKYVFQSEGLSYDVYVEYFHMSDDEYHVKIKKINMPCFNDLKENSPLKKAMSRIKLKNKLELALYEKEPKVLQKI
jgi:hypothetical protein